MNATRNTIAGIVAVLVAGQASAAITEGNVQGGSSLFLSVWDATRSISYTRNLGTNLNGFLPSSITTLPNDGNVAGTPVTGNRTPEAGLTASFPGDALFTSTFAVSNPDNVQWNVVAFDQNASTNTGLSRVSSTATSPPGTTNAGIGLIAFGGQAYLTALLNDYPLFASPNQNSVVATDPSLGSYAGQGSWGEGLNGGNIASAGTGFSGDLGFFYLARTQISGLNSTLATNLRYGNSAGFARWSLAANGTATYTLDSAAMAPVPLPPAVGLFGAGLAAFWGLARRRKAMASAN